ncbi:unnamed protein product [Orchesella dallaii]|uniref:[histone H3]-lysine(27) N-trimethyltransferase n=1 Tax=Orchesella dallaii TaxID=48710 RepID=A0ABP1QYQ3_9HEXA
MGRRRHRSRRERKKIVDSQSQSQETDTEQLSGGPVSEAVKVTTKIYKALEGDVGFKGQPLVRRVYNELLARHQKKTKKVTDYAWRKWMPKICPEEKSSSSSTWTIPQVEGIIKMPAVKPLPPSNGRQYSSEEKSSSSSTIPQVEGIIKMPVVKLLPPSNGRQYSSEEKSSSSSTIPQVEGIIKMPAVKPLPPSNGRQYSSEEKSSSSSTWTIPQVEGIIMMPAVKPLPPSNCWQYSSTNVPSKDSKYLSNLPFINDVVGGGNKFNKELMRMYKGKLHSEYVHDDWSIVDPLVLPDFIRVLMKLEEDFGAGIFFEEYKDDKSGRKEPIKEQLRSYYRSVVAAEEMEYVNRQPSKKVLKAAMSVIKEDTVWENFKERYFRLARRRCPEAYSDRDGHQFAPNIDEPMSAVQGKKKQMDSYAVLFCRQCFKYGCSIHKAANSREDVEIYRSHASTWREAHPREDPKTIPCGYVNRCVRKINDNLEKYPLTKTEEEVKLFLDSWTANDRTLFNCYFESYKNYCMVAFLMRNKTCREVMEYHNVLPKSDETQEGQDNMDCDLDQEDDVELMNLSSSSSCTTVGSELESEAEAEDPAELCSFVPCMHENETCDESCSCISKGIFCEASCGCFKDCKNLFTGCRCQKTCETKACPCFHASRECDPDLCKKCGSDKPNINDATCKNVSIQRGIHKHIKTAESDVKGWGAFAHTPIKKGEFIVEYVGEFISHDEAEKRGHVYDERKHTFLFELNDEYTLDAARIGNKSRFINSSKKPNCKVVKMFVRGELKVAVRALKNIEADEELLFDYQAVVAGKQLKKRKRGQSSSETE